MRKHSDLALVLATALVGVASCGGSSEPTPVKSAAAVPVSADDEAGSQPTDSFPLADEAGAGVENAELRALLVAHWDWQMQQSPVWASTMGDHRFDDAIEDNAESAVLASQAKQREFLQAADALDASALSTTDATHLALFREFLLRGLATDVCENFRWSISARGNAVSAANNIAEDHRIDSLDSARNLLKRYQAIPAMVRNEMSNLRSGLAQKRVANAESLRRTIALVQGQLDKPLAEWMLMKPLAGLEKLQEGSVEERAALAVELQQQIEGPIREAFGEYKTLLESELLPAGREGKDIGTHALPEGGACYQASIEAHINLERSADEIHKLGLAEIARINKEMQALGKTLFKKKSLAATLKHLRQSPDLYYKTKEEIVEKAQTSLARAKARIPEFFGILPKADCTVVEIPAYEAPYTTVAYYKQPHGDGSKPGEYFINTYQPETRARYEMEVLAFHESIPGHHLQIAISQERHELPAFRRYNGSTAFVEGWALYTERLAADMGMYSGDIDRMGMLSFDAWRAARLVVDTGIHAKGWTRKQAEDFMREHTALTEVNIRNEVDRYISWPGQALGYKVGQLEILRLREEAKAALGDAFDIRGFHDAVLKDGAVTLPVLAEQVARWIESQKAALES